VKGGVFRVFTDDTYQLDAVEEIDLSYMQKAVGGNIERVQLVIGKHAYDMWLNEDGIRLKLPVNKFGSYLYRRYRGVDWPIIGNIFFTRGDNSEDCNPLDTDEIANLVLILALAQMTNYEV
jgi:hypothetical protein